MKTKRWSQLLAIALCILLGTKALHAQESDWVGKWTSNEVLLDNKSSQRMSAKFFLCSDYYAWSRFVLKANFSVRGINLMAEVELTCPGEWYDEDGLKIRYNSKFASKTVNRFDIDVKIDYYGGRRLTADDKQIIKQEVEKEAAGYINTIFDEKEFFKNDISMHDLQQKGMSFKKEKVKTPYYLIQRFDPDELDPLAGEDGIGGFEVIDQHDVPFLGAVLGVFYFPAEQGAELGLFIRREKITPLYTKQYDFTGMCFGGHDTDLLSDNEKQKYMKKCYDYRDTKMCPYEGERSFMFSDGRTYDGEWKNQRPSGKGKVVFPDGTYKEGTWMAGVFVSGTGHIKYAGGTYDGDIKGDFPDGQGTKIMSNGKYSGQWQQGVLISGSAEKTVNNMKLVCNVTDGKLTGNGRMVGGNGEFNGVWEDGVFQSGIIKVNQVYEYEGSYKNSSFLKGKCVLSNGIVLNGDWQNMKLKNGSVCVNFSSGAYTKFEGAVVDGVLCSGSFYDKSGYVISSEWNKHAFCDKLSISFPNGDSATGKWIRSTGLLLAESILEYKWADGISCAYTVSPKLKLTKPTYYQPDGSQAKGRVAKDRTMAKTAGEDFSIHPIKLDDILSAVNALYKLPN